MNIIYFALFYEEKDGNYSVFIPDLNNISTCGDTLEKSILMAEELIAITILDKLKKKEIIPNRSKIDDISFERLENYLKIKNWNYVSKFKSYILVVLEFYRKKLNY